MLLAWLDSAHTVPSEFPFDWRRTDSTHAVPSEFPLDWQLTARAPEYTLTAREEVPC